VLASFLECTLVDVRLSPAIVLWCNTSRNVRSMTMGRLFCQGAPLAMQHVKHSPQSSGCTLTSGSTSISGEMQGQAWAWGSTRAAIETASSSPSCATPPNQSSPLPLPHPSSWAATPAPHPLPPTPWITNCLVRGRIEFGAHTCCRQRKRTCPKQSLCQHERWHNGSKADSLSVLLAGKPRSSQEGPRKQRFALGTQLLNSCNI
jgi:hypothetical protein